MWGNTGYACYMGQHGATLCIGNMQRLHCVAMCGNTGLHCGAMLGYTVCVGQHGVSYTVLRGYNNNYEMTDTQL